jgi:predicted deacylase
VDFRADPGLPAVLVVSGEHATEFAGQHAVRGIVEFLASDDPAAGDLRRRFRVMVCPQANPDGNVLASMCHNAAGTNLCESYGGPDGPDPVRAPECRAVLDWASAASPILVLNFHGGTWTVGNPPHHFVLRVSPQRHPSPLGAARQEAVDRAILEHTDGASRSGRLQESQGDGCLHNHCATRLWSAAGVCYEPELGTGIAECRRTGVRVLRAAADALW